MAESGHEQPVGLAAWEAGFGSESGGSTVTTWQVKTDPKTAPKGGLLFVPLRSKLATGGFDAARLTTWSDVVRLLGQHKTGTPAW
jgi:hypothetical protein